MTNETDGIRIDVPAEQTKNGSQEPAIETPSAELRAEELEQRIAPFGVASATTPIPIPYPNLG